MRSYAAAPLLEQPPAFTVRFCSKCGSPVPQPDLESGGFEIPVGTLDDAANVTPDKHIYIDLKADRDDMDRTIPTFTKHGNRSFRANHGRVAAKRHAE